MATEMVRARSAADLVEIEAILAAVSAEQPRSDLDTQRASVGVDRGASQLTAIVRLLDERGIAVDDVGLRRPTLDEVFLAATGQPVAAGVGSPE